MHITPLEALVEAVPQAFSVAPMGHAHAGNWSGHWRGWQVVPEGVRNLAELVGAEPHGTRAAGTLDLGHCRMVLVHALDVKLPVL